MMDANLRRLKREAKELLRAIRKHHPVAVADLQTFHPESVAPETAKLADAQLVLARSYRLPSWPRLVLACKMTDAIRTWLLEHGANPDTRAEVDGDGFGGHTPLFGCVVSQPYSACCRTDDRFARLLLDAGADPNARASLRKRLRFVADERLHEYRDVTPVSWGQQFHDQAWVNPAVMKLIANRGGLL